MFLLAFHISHQPMSNQCNPNGPPIFPSLTSSSTWRALSTASEVPDFDLCKRKVWGEPTPRPGLLNEQRLRFAFAMLADAILASKQCQ